MTSKEAPAGLRMRFSGADDMARAVRNSGTSHWFDADTLRFFHCRVGEPLYGPGGRVFVTSERNPSGVRRYSVRVLCDNEGTYVVQTIGAFGAYASRDGAHAAARRLTHNTVIRAYLDDMPYIDDEHTTRMAEIVNIPTTGGF